MITLRLNVSKELAEAAKALNYKTFLKAVHDAASETSKQFSKVLKEATPVDTGHARNSWYSRMASQENSTLILFTLDVPYGFPLEKGSVVGRKPWPSVGPRTVLHEGRIYSSQAPGGITEKAFKIMSKEELKRKFLESFRWYGGKK